MKIKSIVEKFVSERPHAVGDTVQWGWFIFRIAECGLKPRVESFDFREMASFTEDFSECERIRWLQFSALAQFGVLECPCTLLQTALVSVSYAPERNDAFITRQEPANGNDSGWYVGVFDDPRDMDNVSSFCHRSLYELTIRDMRLAPYWLLPPGTVVPVTHKLTAAP